jgi:hypothetical protein
MVTGRQAFARPTAAETLAVSIPNAPSSRSLRTGLATLLSMRWACS